jgi:AhpD family alkylhydroperoxidase
MSRIAAIAENEKTDEMDRLIKAAERTGAPDPRIASILVRASSGRSFLGFWNTIFYDGILPVRLKELVRILMSVAHECGYCSTVRSTIAIEEGVTEEIIGELAEFDRSGQFTEREKAAFRYAMLFKSGDGLIDSDEVYHVLGLHFTDEEIIELGLFCAAVDGAGKFARSMAIVTWSEACSIVPMLKRA